MLLVLIIYCLYTLKESKNNAMANDCPQCAENWMICGSSAVFDTLQLRNVLAYWFINFNYNTEFHFIYTYTLHYITLYTDGHAKMHAHYDMIWYDINSNPFCDIFNEAILIWFVNRSQFDLLSSILFCLNCMNLFRISFFFLAIFFHSSLFVAIFCWK